MKDKLPSPSSPALKQNVITISNKDFMKIFYQLISNSVLADVHFSGLLAFPNDDGWWVPFANHLTGVSLMMMNVQRAYEFKPSLWFDVKDILVEFTFAKITKFNDKLTDMNLGKDTPEVVRDYHKVALQTLRGIIEMSDELLSKQQ